MTPGQWGISAAIAMAAAGLLLAVMPAIARKLRLERQNFAGETIFTGYGLAIWLPAALALGWSMTHGLPGAGPAVTALVIFGLVGLADDRWGDRSAAGFRGHLRKLSEEGKLTTGLVKLAVGGGAALALGLWLAGDAAPPLLRVLLEPSTPSTAPLPPLPDLAPRPPPAWVGVVRIGVGATVIALGANTVNLFDLRPLRALKLFATGALLLLAAAALPLLAGSHLAGLLPWRPAPPSTMPAPFGSGYPVSAAVAPGVGAGLLGPALAAALLYAPLEARRRAMLGDTGANALGALLGVAACVLLPLIELSVLAAALAGFNLYAENHSLSALIRSRPLLDRLDAWGWRKVEGG